MITIHQRIPMDSDGTCWWEFHGLSTDVKPTGEYPEGSGYKVGNGSVFVIIDHNAISLFDQENTQWGEEV